jgi:hypothetical protein
MTFGSAIHVTAGDRRVAVLHDKLRLSVRFRARRPDVEVVRNRCKVRAAVGSPEQPGCPQERAL